MVAMSDRLLVVLLKIIYAGLLMYDAHPAPGAVPESSVIPPTTWKTLFPP
jgi:hypothetical protein